MENGIFTLDLANIKGAIVTTVIAAVGATAIYFAGVHDFFKIDWHIVVNIALGAASTSLVKNFFTTSDGKFLGITKTVSTNP